ncbi:MAG TPA: hypothetical protein DDW50_05180 [Firmicutes bacterium]|jgi:4-amino-4-deoxy-L-arabinose transferase-like glycosyltransferase|nr:hypothetical protein [Bacillota bacterium]
MSVKFKHFFKYAVILCFTLAAGCNLFFLNTYNLHPDEAYFWVWSRQLSPGYFDNSPMVAYIIRFFTLAGQTEFWIRMPAFLSWVFFLWVVYLFAHRIYQNKKTAYLAVLLAVFTPLIATGSHIMTTDIPLIFWASLTWYFLYLAIEEENRNIWYIVGLMFGLSLLAKLQAILMLGAVGAMLLIRPTKRHWIFRKEPYVAIFFGLVLFTPVLYWNSEHQWAMFKFSIQHGIHQKFDFQYLLEFWGGQLFVFSLIFIALFYYTYKNLLHWKTISSKNAFLIGCYLPIYGFFSLTSLSYTALPNWPAIAYLPAIIFLAGQFQETWQKNILIKRRLLAFYIVCSFFLTLILLFIARYPGFFINTLKIQLPNSMIITNNNFGWEETAKEIDDIIAQKFPNAKKAVPIFCDGSYQTASELQFYLKKRVAVFTTREARHSQFDYLLLSKIKNYQQKPGLLILKNHLPIGINYYFENTSLLRPITIYRFHNQIRKLHIYYFKRLNAPALYKAALHKPLGYPGTYPTSSTK